MPSKLPEIESALVLRKAGQKDCVLSICVDGKSYQWPMKKRRVLNLIATAADALNDQRE